MITQVEALKIAREALERAKYAIKGREHTGFIDSALAALATVDASPSPVSVQPSDEQMEKARDAVAEALGDAYDCTRVWSAWGYETMTRDDFSLVAEDSNRVAEIADAAIKAILSTQPAAQTQGTGQVGKLRATLHAIAHTLDDHELRKTAKEAYEASFAQPAQPISSDAQEPTSNQNARFAIDGAIQYGKWGTNKPPSDDHWLMEYWNIGRDLAKAASPAPDVRPAGRFADNAAMEGQELSIDVSTGEDDARHRVYAQLTGKVVPTGDGTVWLAKKTGQNFPAPDVRPIDMILHCPSCGLQHIDAPDERTPNWKNEPHRSHLCHGCGHIWRPADVPTNGVAAIKTKGKADSATAQPQKSVATVRVTHKGYGMELSTYVAYALPEGMHDLYAAPVAAQPQEAGQAAPSVPEGWRERLCEMQDAGYTYSQYPELAHAIFDSVINALDELEASAPSSPSVSAAKVELTDDMLRAFSDRHDPHLAVASASDLRSIVEDARTIEFAAIAAQSKEEGGA